MNQIEVPSWVVRAAMNAEFCGKSMRDALAFGTDHDEEILHAALTAALGAWVVLVGRRQPHKEYLMHTRAHDDYAAGLFGDAGINIAAKFTEQVYVLRQEKPE